MAGGRTRGLREALARTASGGADAAGDGLVAGAATTALFVLLGGDAIWLPLLAKTVCSSLRAWRAEEDATCDSGGIMDGGVGSETKESGVLQLKQRSG